MSGKLILHFENNSTGELASQLTIWWHRWYFGNWEYCERSGEHTSRLAFLDLDWCSGIRTGTLRSGILASKLVKLEHRRPNWKTKLATELADDLAGDLADDLAAKLVDDLAGNLADVPNWKTFRRTNW